ncbi:hypothetical protein VTK26DRAFT_2364 [Humicola hyalothermophila]
MSATSDGAGMCRVILGQPIHYSTRSQSWTKLQVSGLPLCLCTDLALNSPANPASKCWSRVLLTPNQTSVPRLHSGRKPLIPQVSCRLLGQFVKPAPSPKTMSINRPLRGGCQCGRNHYIIQFPPDTTPRQRLGRVVFSTDPLHRKHPFTNLNELET